MLFFILALIIAPSSFAQGEQIEAPKNLPKNAYKKRYGSGWECKGTFEQKNDLYVALIIPNNAFLDRQGRSCRCERGYERITSLLG